MDTINTYLDNMFATLPQTERLAALKAEMQSNMRERYEELKSGGATENEAIGKVISEFGNLDELIAGLGLEKNMPDEPAQAAVYDAPAARRPKRADQIIGLVGSVVWPLIVIIYLCLGFFAGLWHPGWLLFPVTGILFGIFSGLVNYQHNRE